MNKITRKQYKELSDNTINTKEFNKLLEKYTGIEAKPYTGYQYFDEVGNYIGDSEHNNLSDLLHNAYIKVVNE